MGEFTKEEEQILQQFCSNTNRPVFILKNLPEVIKGALFSRYSRSTKSLRRLLLDEFIKNKEAGLEVTDVKTDLKDAVKKAQDFYDRILDGYGDDSVGELGGAHLACEFISNIAAKYIEDSRIGGSPLEKSTRYVYFNQKVDGDYMFYKEPKIMASKYKQSYLQTNRMLFDLYSEMIEVMTKYVEERYPLAEFGFFDIRNKKEIPFSQIEDEKVKSRAEKAYTAAVRAKALDIIRGILPASTQTNVGIFGNGRFFQQTLTKMYSSELAEIRSLASSIHEELNTLIPSFVRRAKADSYLQQKSMEKISSDADESQEVTLISYDEDREIESIAAMIYPQSNLSMLQLMKEVEKMTSEQKEKIIQAYVGERKTRRDKPGRAFENIYVTFDILADFGNYRDLQRHRILSQQRQLLSTEHGYYIPEEIVDAGYKEKYVNAMKLAKEAHDDIASEYAQEAQYVVPMAYKVRWYIKMNLREMIHFVELRSSQQGHPGYRRIAQEMLKELEKVAPHMAKYFQFADMNEYPLGRIKAEMRSAEKMERYK